MFYLEELNINHGVSEDVKKVNRQDVLINRIQIIGWYFK